MQNKIPRLEIKTNNNKNFICKETAKSLKVLFSALGYSLVKENGWNVIQTEVSLRNISEAEKVLYGKTFDKKVYISYIGGGDFKDFLKACFEEVYEKHLTDKYEIISCKFENFDYLKPNGLEEDENVGKLIEFKRKFTGNILLRLGVKPTVYTYSCLLRKRTF